MDQVADKLIQKYQVSTCEQLWQERAAQRGQPRSPAQQQAIEILRGNPQMLTAFINKVAAPIATKMFECGMIP
jgi:Creb binding domain-containing protein